MKREYLDSVIFQLSLNKKPYEMFLELLMEYFFNLTFTEDELNNLKDNNDNIDKIIKDIETKYGIVLQSYSLKIWLDREFTLKENKLILNEYKDSSIANIEKDINKKKHDEKEFLNKISYMRNKFIDYAKSKGLNINKEEAKDIFLKYNYINYIPYDDINEDSKVESSHNKKNFLFYNFVKEIIDNNVEDDLKIIEDCGIANQFSNMVFSKDSFNREIFNETNFYLDTPIILKYLGYAGISIQDSYRKLLNSIRGYKGKIAIFNHIIEEMQAIIYTLQLRVTQGFLNAPNVNEFLNALKEAKKENKKIPLENNDINDAIEKEGIFIDNNTYIDSNMSDEKNMIDILIDENNLKEYMLSEYKVDKKKNEYLLKTRIDVDIKSTALVSINRNRYKKSCFLLTQNNAFKKSVKKYHDDNEEYLDYNSNEILTENDIIFNLWQNIENNSNSDFRTFFRLKCFSYLKIDDNFKEEFYRTAKRRYEQANQDKKDNLKYLNNILIQNPQYLGEAYRKKMESNTETYKIFKELVDSGIDDIKKEALNKAKKQYDEQTEQTIKKDKEKSDLEKNKVLNENERLIKEKEEAEKNRKLAEVRLEIEKDHYKKREYIKTKRRNIKIKKNACVVLISALISILIFILIKNNEYIKIFIDKNRKVPNIVTGIIIFIIVNLITFLLKNIYDKIKKKR